MKIAIVGSSHLTKDEEKEVRKICFSILKRTSDEEIIVISGGAKGVDTIAVNVAIKLGYQTVEFLPTKQDDKKSYFERNMKIAKACEKLYCITTPTKDKECYHHVPPKDHQKTAGCWTMNQAKALGRSCKLIITPKIILD